ncbi:MAG TPA: acyl-CoA dehydrogenase family protein [Acidimicrobiales bacterium]|nr:acyl-CoA dehydrogenase family protein [Acidimicrobiales bacterium]
MTDARSSSLSENMSAGDRLAEIAQRIAEEVTGPAAYDVDLRARFPIESIAALKEARVLSALVPVEQGGMGATLTDISHVIRVLSRSCAATGSVVGMHMEQLFVLQKYGTTEPLRRVLKDVVDDQLLIANANSEVGIGGDVMRSISALEPDGDGWLFDKQALAASYGADADLILSTARRAPDATETDQVLTLLRTSNLTLEPTTGWDTLGLRGTCSSGMHITGHVTADDIFPVPFAEIANGGGGQLRHVLMTSVWTGLAEAAMEEAHEAVRVAARKTIGTTPQSAVRLAEIMVEVQSARSMLAEALRQIEDAIEAGTIDDIGLVMSLRNVKVVSSTAAINAATAALQICGINGFRRGKDHRLERIVRDACGALIMVSNDRYLQENAQMMPVRKAI